MPARRVERDLLLHYIVDDDTDPWSQPQSIVLLHGLGQSGAVWRGWVPHLAREYRVIRPDLRGFGASLRVPRLVRCCY
jgi:3-oxoadipate enol-lactonase